MSITPEVFTVKDLVEKVKAGEQMLIHVTQFAAFLTETEYLRLAYCIKTTVVGDQVVLERWDIGRDNEVGGAKGGGSGHLWLQ